MNSRIFGAGVAVALAVAPLATSAASAVPATQFRQIVAGTYHSCGVTTAGAAMCWGRNDLGQVGDGTTNERHTPVVVAGLSAGVRSISPGSFHTCAVLDNGSVKCWGHNAYGALGDGTERTRLRPVQVLGLFSGVATVRASYYSTCALTKAGKALCWGNNEHGQLGDGTTHSRLTPAPVAGLTSGVAAISLADRHACALLTSGLAKCWGDNYYGQLGDGTARNSRTTPVAVTSVGGSVAAITAGGWFYTCARTSAGAVKCWGNNEFGQLGFGTWDDDAHPVPTPVPGLARGVNAISVGTAHGCARLTGGAMKCWGHGNSGELGNGTTPDYSTAVPVSGMDSGASSISAGDYVSCALQAGVGKCWGTNDYGEVGDGTTITRTRPALVG